MVSTQKTDILDYGIRVLRSRHAEIRKLKRFHSPTCHGFRVWPSSWLLIDWLNRRGMHDSMRVLEVGCGWGLAGIYCAKNHGADVTGADIDPEVFPFLDLHAEINDVEVKTMNRGFDGLTEGQLQHFDLLIGADICFWDTQVNPLKGLISRALGTNIPMILISDPGRPPFERLGKYFTERGKGEVRDWEVNHPHPIAGRILKLGSLFNTDGNRGPGTPLLA